MKKIKIFMVLLACLVSVSVDSYAERYGATNDAITNACYEISAKRCGARAHTKTIGAVVGGVAGFSVGSLIPAGRGIRFVVGGPIMTIGGALAGAKIGNNMNYKANEYLYFNDGSCLECDTYQMGENYECPNGTIVTDGTNAFKCQTQTFGDKWTEYKIPFCNNSAIKNEQGVEGAVVDIQSTVNKPLNNASVFSGDACYMVYCPDGSSLSADGKKCVTYNANCKTENGKFLSTGETEQIQCDKDNSNIFGQLAHGGALKSMSHVIKGDKSKCTATCKVDGWDITLKDDGCEKGYKPDSERKTCGNGSQTGDPELIAACVNSGGSWFGGKCSCDNKSHIVQDVPGKTCKCESDAYKFNLDKRACEITDTEQLRQNCEKAAKNASSGVEGWDGVSKCICKQYAEMYIFDGISKCVQDERYKLCVAKSKEAYWNRDEGKCVCINKDFEWNYNRCDKKGEVIIAENEAATTKKVRSLVEGLTSKFASFGTSVWKDKEGNFNKARLASDSIAGVVLGTAGGLITSHVVKKNQVKSGFEDLQCTVGGQKVADWGDEFTVGIK